MVFALMIGSLTVLSESLASVKSVVGDRAMPPAGRDSINSYLARAIDARESKYSRWTGATTVTTPISGCAILARAEISPACDIPISMTAMSCSGSSFRSIRGRPK